MNYETIAAYLAGECTKTEKQEIERWRQENTENEQNFERWQVLWQASGKNRQNFKPDTAKAWQKINPANQPSAPFKEIHHNPQPKLFDWVKKLAAILLLAIGLGWGLWELSRVMDTPAISWIEKTTAHTKNEVLLADGTKIWLNEQSKLRYPEQFNTNTREVFLEGEAFFEVAENSQKPFLIHTQGAVTRVLGTSFNVRSYIIEPTIEVNLVSGKVAFGLANKASDKNVTLKPSQKAVLNKATQVITISGTQDTNFLAWKTGTLVFQDATLRDALQAIEQYYKVKFAVADSPLLDCRFTGSFTKASLEDILQVFAFGSDISYQKKGNTYVLSGKGCK
jgi:ferric-dicitrate binding protein FerR (iron transport regulator)